MNNKSLPKPYRPLQILVNGGGQSIAWYVCVMSAANGSHWGAPLSLLVLLLLHALLHNRDIWPTTGRLLLVGLIFGLVFDTILISLGIYIPQRAWLAAPLPPLWFLILWMNFCMCLHVAFRPLQHRPILAALIGGIFGPSAFLGAARLGALTLPEPTAWRLGVLAIAWAMGVWFLARIARFIENHSAEPPSVNTSIHLHKKTKFPTSTPLGL